MDSKKLKKTVWGLFLFIPLSLFLNFALAQAAAPNKELSIEMIRFGMEVYERHQYDEAIAFFKKAVQADPENKKAWKYYDLSLIYQLAAQIESDRASLSSIVVKPSNSETTPKTEPDIEEEEGC